MKAAGQGATHTHTQVPVHITTPAHTCTQQLAEVQGETWTCSYRPSNELLGLVCFKTKQGAKPALPRCRLLHPALLTQGSSPRARLAWLLPGAPRQPGSDPTSVSHPCPSAHGQLKAKTSLGHLCPPTTLQRATYPPTPFPAHTLCSRIFTFCKWALPRPCAPLGTALLSTVPRGAFQLPTAEPATFSFEGLACHHHWVDKVPQSWPWASPASRPHRAPDQLSLEGSLSPGRPHRLQPESPLPT